MNILDLQQVPRCITTLAEWHHAEWSYLDPGGSIEKRIEKMQMYLGPDLVPRTFIGMEDGRLLGSAAIVEHDMDTRMELSPWLASVYVEPSSRRRGIGSALVRHVMDYARAVGFDNLYLFTPGHARFYAAHGWSRMSSEIYRGHAVTVMQAKLCD